MTTVPFKGKAKPLDDVDLPRLASRLGAHVGEDPLHAFMDTESLGSGFYPNGSVKRLYEPHVAYRDAGPGPVRDALVKAGLAASKGEARRGVEQKGFSVNGVQVASVDQKLGSGDLVAGTNMLLQKGRKAFALFVTAP